MSSPKLFSAAEAQKQLTVEAAVHAVQKVGWNGRKAAEYYETPRTTLQCRLLNLQPGRHGGKTKIPSHEENGLADFLINSSDIGIPLNRQHCAGVIVEMNTQLIKLCTVITLM
ncbi:hypothetical protein RvY_19406 [Ramazzottius varieornatus]|uniref:HTH psq-type domain-containing protein n=1 Tax=Ramazzottius varieornatus TaxID=947166 RepID=A0A1D1W9A3_RAMVA|nr:hypothetical protein RvY_19406 [Ramazzottius varieornatus]